MNECMNIYELIQKELDGELTPEEMELLDKHCSHCFACQELRQDFFQTIYGLNNLPELDPGEALIETIMNTIYSKSPAQKSLPSKSFTGIVAGLVLFCSSGIFLLGSVLISLIAGGLLYLGYENSSLGFIENIVYWLTYGYNLLSVFKNVFNNPYSSLFLVTVLLLSMVSFAILIMLLYSRRIINYENV